MFLHGKRRFACWCRFGAAGFGADSPSGGMEEHSAWKTGLVKPVMAGGHRDLWMWEELCQYPELPNGCEATSLAAVLRFLGYDVTARRSWCTAISPASPSSTARTACSPAAGPGRGVRGLAGGRIYGVLLLCRAHRAGRQTSIWPNRTPAGAGGYHRGVGAGSGCAGWTRARR